MRILAMRASFFLAFALLLLDYTAQSKDPLRTDGGSATAGSRPAPPAAESKGGGTAPTTTSPPGFSTPHTPGLGTIIYMPDLRATSFQSLGSYYIWNDYYSYLLSHFSLDPAYFDRFYRNTEPLITPTILKLTLREPIGFSSEILVSIDQLEEILASDSGKTPTASQALKAKAKQIRELAKRIRRNQTLSCLDLRENKDLNGKSEYAALAPESIQKLREMAADLDRQLRDMYNQSSTSTVSVDSYKEPSLESLAKGIERICKEIERQSKRL